MKVLGISAYGQNPAVALVVDGVLVAFAEEERFTRQKGAYKDFPSQAVRWCLQYAGMEFNAVDVIAVGWDHLKYRWQMPWFFVKSFLKYGLTSLGDGTGEIFKELIERQPGNFKVAMLRDLNTVMRVDRLPKVQYFEHHLAHAASSYFASGYDEALVLVIDGSGEEKSTSVYLGKKSYLTLVETVELPDSFGWYWAAFTDFLGFKPYEEDGFLMGLAPYGRFDTEIYKVVSKVLRLTATGYRVNPAYTRLGRHHQSEHFSDRLVRELGKPRRKGEELTQWHKDIAYVVQLRLEEVVSDYVTKLAAKYPQENLCLAGGVAQNVKLNGKIRDLGLFENIYIQPASHDCGTALGAAWLGSKKNRRDKRMVTAYFGPEYTMSLIESVLINAGVKFQRSQDVMVVAAKALWSGKIVGWFQGRMEVGPRALGNRSILANPLMASMHDLVNERVKFRDTWRPFCPSVTVEKAKEYFMGIGEEGMFMNCSYQVKPKMQTVIPSVVHVDGSARPQTVSKSQNERYWRLLREFGRLSGHEILLNTSLNVKGEPMANSPLDALRCFFTTGMDLLIIGDFIVEK